MFHEVNISLKSKKGNNPRLIRCFNNVTSTEDIQLQLLHNY